MRARKTQQPSAGIDFMQGISGLWRRPLVVLTPILIGIAALTAVLKYYPSSYYAQTVLIFDPRESIITETKTTSGPIADPFRKVKSEAKIMQSLYVLEKAADNLELYKDEDFLSSSPTNIFIGRLKSNLLPQSFFATPSDASEEDLEDLSDAELELIKRKLTSYAASRIADGLKVETDLSSLIVTISYSGTDRDLVAKIANETANAYLNTQLGSRFEAVKRANVWLNERAAKLREDVRNAEKRVNDYRIENGLVGVDSGTGFEEELLALNKQLQEAKSATLEAQANYEQAKAASSEKLGETIMVNDKNADQLNRLRDRLAEAKKKQAELRSRLGKRHPSVVKINAQSSALAEELRSEIGRVVNRLKFSYEASLSTEGRIEEQIKQLKSQAKIANKATVKLKQLEREAESIKDLYNSFLAKQRESAEYKQLKSTDFRIVSEAVTPDEPTGVNRTLIALLILFGAASAGASGAFLLELLDRRIKSAEQIEDGLGMQVIASVPKLTARQINIEANFDARSSRKGKLKQGLKKALKQVGMSEDDRYGDHKEETSYKSLKKLFVFNEGISQLRSTLEFKNGDNPAQIVLITSPLGNAGKSTISYVLSKHAAKANVKTVLVDCDTRHPTAHTADGNNPENGLVELIQGKAELSDVTITDEVSGLDIIPLSRALPGSLFDRIKRDDIKPILKMLEAQYDFIILDSPPILPVADTAIWANFADDVILIAEWNETTKRDLEHAAIRLQRVDTDVTGVVLNKMPSSQLIDYYGQI